MDDGSVVISVDMNVNEAEQELARLKKKIFRLEETLSTATAKKSIYAMELEKVRKEYEEVQSRATITSTGRIERSQIDLDRLLELGQKMKDINKSIDAQNKAIEDADVNLRAVKHRYAEVTLNAISAAEAAKEQAEAEKEIELSTDNVANSTEAVAEAEKEAEKAADPFGESMKAAGEKASKAMDKLINRIKRLAARALVFSVITQALRGVRTWLGNVIKSNSQATAALAKLKGALLTLAQPLVNVIIPAFTALVNALTKVVRVAAQVVSMLFGQTIKGSAAAAESLYNETAALNSTGAAAKKAAKSLANFDEINQLQDGSAGSGGSGTIKPDFEIGESLPESQLKNILNLVELIGSALVAWKISSALGLGLKGFAGILVAVYSAMKFVQNLIDAWNNGASWGNLQGMLLSLSGVALGLYVALGSVAAGISLVVGGVAMLVTGFKDAFTNGWSLENLLTSVAGIMMTGLGIGVLTGTFFPLLLGGIASILLAITVATGHGEELLDGLRTMLSGFKDFFVGIFTGDIEKAIDGIKKVVDGAGAAVQAVISGVRDMFNSFLDWLDEKTGGKLTGIINFIRELFNGLFASVSSTLSDLLGAVKDILGGVITFISGVFSLDWEKALEGLKGIFKGALNGIISILEGALNVIMNGVRAVVNGAIKLLNLIPGVDIQLKDADWGAIKLPRLATGAVIPPNREFLAVLGDQKSGTNIEAPLDTIVQAFRQVMSEQGGSGNNRPIYLMLDRRELGRAVLEVGDQERVRVGVSLT